MGTSLNDLFRAWLLRQLGITESSLSNNDLATLVYSKDPFGNGSSENVLTTGLVFFSNDDVTKSLRLGQLQADGKTWVEVGDGNPVWTPPSSFIRDPSITPHALLDGYWYMCWTTVHDTDPSTGENGSIFNVAKSKDLMDWTVVKSVDIDPDASKGITRTWAPEWFEDSDGSLHILVAGGTSNGDGSINFFTLFEIHPQDPVNQQNAWSAAVAVPVTGRTDNIDPVLVKQNDTYVLIYKDRRDGFKFVEFASSDSLLGPYTPYKTGDHSGWGTMEGATIWKKPSGDFRMFMDQYLNADSTTSYRYSDSSSDNLLNCSWSSTEPCSVPRRVSHGTVFEITDQEVAFMQSTTAYNLEKSSVSGGSGSGLHGCKVLTLTVQTGLATNTWVTSTFSASSSVFDTDSLHNTQQEARFTVPVGLGGKWRIDAAVSFATNTSGSRSVRPTVNGAAPSNINVIRYMAVPGNWTTAFSSNILVLNESDYIQVQGWQDSGTSLDMESAIFSMTYLGN